MKEHFYISGGYELSYGLQIGGGLKNGMRANVDLSSLVMTDLEISNKGINGKSSHDPDKITQNLSLARFGGIDYKRTTQDSNSVNEFSYGIIGFGQIITFDDDGNTLETFVGFDPSLNMEFIIGLEINFRIGFTY